MRCGDAANLPDARTVAGAIAQDEHGARARDAGSDRAPCLPRRGVVGYVEAILDVASSQPAAASVASSMSKMSSTLGSASAETSGMRVTLWPV